VYVQHLIEEQAHFLWKLISGGGHVYVCGATRMGADVATAFEHVFRSQGNLAPDAAANLLRELQAEGRYVTELWSS
jgi:sulfite reductase alpha subunit-like flavoprotein